jgi:hypothetical protein
MSICAFDIRLMTDVLGREQREHRVFEQLLDSYPGLLERLKGGSEEEILHVGELVHFFSVQRERVLIIYRSAREPQALEAMIQRH